MRLLTAFLVCVAITFAAAATTTRKPKPTTEEPKEATKLTPKTAKPTPKAKSKASKATPKPKVQTKTTNLPKVTKAPAKSAKGVPKTTQSTKKTTTKKSSPKPTKMADLPPISDHNLIAFLTEEGVSRENIEKELVLLHAEIAKGAYGSGEEEPIEFDEKRFIANMKAKDVANAEIQARLKEIRAQIKAGTFYEAQGE